MVDIVKVDDAEISPVPRDYDVRTLSAEESDTFCSVQGTSREDKATVFNAANNPQHKINDFINKKINVKDVYAETLELLKEETGELQKAPRIVLIDDKKEAYECVSVGMFSSLKKLIAVFGEPTWDEPVPVVIRQEKVAKGTMLTMSVEL